MTNDERDSVIMEKLNEGMSLSDVQKLLASEYGIRMTYLELRMLAADLEINWAKQDKPKPQPAAPAPQPMPPQAAEAETDEAEPMTDDSETEAADENDELEEADEAAEADEADETAEAAEDGAAAAGETKVTLDEPPVPGTAMSGTVVFLSGASGKWALTRDGRLGFEADEGSAEPDENDFAAFQQALRRKLSGEDEPDDPNAGPTVVDMDAVVRPGVQLSGTVKFSSGAHGVWAITNQGQLDFQLDEGSSKPTRKDAVKFQQELQALLRKKGYGG